MPELPEVQTIVRQLQQTIVSRKIRSVEVLRASVLKTEAGVFIQSLRDRSIDKIERKGKYLIFTLSGGIFLLVHLKMTGKFILTEQRRSVQSHDRIIFHLDNGQQLIFNDVRCFGKLELIDNINEHIALKELGWDPWDTQLTAKSFLQKIQPRKTSLKSILMDQSVIAGLGNIYVSEILFDSAIHPATLGSNLNLDQAKRVIQSTRKILKLALEKNGTSISDYRRIDEKQGEFQHLLKVYGKKGQPCKTCSSPIVQITQNQRSTFFCPVCQVLGN